MAEIVGHEVSRSTLRALGAGQTLDARILASHTIQVVARIFHSEVSGLASLAVPIGIIPALIDEISNV